VRVNGIVHLRRMLPEGATVPLGWIAVGDPDEILPPYEHGRIWAIQKSLDLFGVEQPRGVFRSLPVPQFVLPQPSRSQAIGGST